MEDSIFDEPDDELVLRSKNGDKEAFDILVQRYRKPLFRFVYHSLRQREDAEDITQESFVRAYLSLSQLKNNRLFKIWLFRIALNLIKDNKRAEKRKPVVSLDALQEETGLQLDEEDYPSEEELERKKIMERIQKEIASLPMELKEVIILRDLQGFSYEEISLLLRCPMGTIKSRLFNARQILRNKLKDILGDEEDEM